MEHCLKCGALIPEGYDFMCLTCGLVPLCDACYYDHSAADQHDEYLPKEE